MNMPDARLEREVHRLERELQTLKLTRYADAATSDYYLRIKGQYARRKALLEIQRCRRTLPQLDRAANL